MTQVVVENTLVAVQTTNNLIKIVASPAPPDLQALIASLGISGGGVAISSDENNATTLGNDGGVYTPANVDLGTFN